jgi:hypothetical protein
MARPRTDERDQLSELSDLIDLMRRRGVLKLVHQGTEILLGAEPVKLEKAERDPLAMRRSFYEEQLGRPVSDQELEKLP